MVLLLPISPFIAILSLLFLSTPLVSSSTPKTTQESFLQCLLHHSPSTPNTQLLYTPNTTSFTTLYQSSINNLAVLTSKTKRPLLIIAPTRLSEVQASVICSREHGLRIRVRSGGHDYEGLSYISYGDPFLILDLNKLRSIEIDAKHGTVWVQSGVTLGELYYKIADMNKTLGFPAGLCPTVGVGGHFSGGGFGPMVRKYGLAVDNMVDAQLVDVHGRILERESMGEDLFWAIRGGGGASFGVIIAYKIKLVPVPSKVTVFTVSRILSQGATKIVNKWQHIAHKLHEDLFIRGILQVVNDERGNKTIQVSFNSLFLGESKQLLSLMGESFPELGLEAKDCKEVSWIESVLYFAGYTNGEPLDTLLDRRPQFNSSFKAKSDFVSEPFTEMGWEGIWKWFLEGEELPFMLIDPYGGRMNEISESETPFPHRKGSLYNIQYVVRWAADEGTAESEKHVDWIRRFYKYMAPYVSKHPRAAYLNYRDLDLGRNEEGDISYSKAKEWGKKYFKNNFRRLAYVKSQVDPDNFFWNEQSIPPLLSRRSLM